MNDVHICVRVDVAHVASEVEEVEFALVNSEVARLDVSVNVLDLMDFPYRIKHIYG